MKKRFILGFVAAIVVTIGACVGDDPNSDTAKGGGIGEPCVGDVCLAGLACVSGVCRVPSAADGSVTVSDGSSSSSTSSSSSSSGFDASNLHDADLDAEAGADANADADAETDTPKDADADASDAVAQCSEKSTAEVTCSEHDSAPGTGVAWATPEGACTAGTATVTLDENGATAVTNALRLNNFGVYSFQPGTSLHSVTVRINFTVDVLTQLTIGLYAVGNTTPFDEITRGVSASGSLTQVLKTKALTSGELNAGFLSIHIAAESSDNVVHLAIDTVTVTVEYCDP